MKTLILTLALALISAPAFAISEAPKCVTNQKAVDFYEFIIRGNELMQRNFEAAGIPRDPQTDNATTDATRKRDIYKIAASTNPNGTASPCVYAFPRFDYTKANKL